MDIIAGVIIGIVVLTILVVIHELGHALVAKRHGVVVEEFGIGFPPRAWSKQVPNSILGKNVTYSINWLPLGGFVKLQGENDAANAKGDYGAATLWQKTQILLAGVAMNWLAAAALLSVLAAVGIPNILRDQFYLPTDAQFISQPVQLVAVTPGLPAAEAGLQQGDQILRVNGEPLENAEQLSALTKENRGKTIEVIYSRQDVEGSVKIPLRNNNADKRGYLGASPSQMELIKASWSAPIVGVVTAAQMSWATVQGLGDVISNAVSGLVMKFSTDQAARAQGGEKLAAAGDSVAGPVGIFGVIFPAAEKAGLMHVVLLAAIISLTLAVMNLLPIPALDGGRWFVTMLFRVMKRPLGKDLEEKIHGTGFMILVVIIVLITIADIGKLQN